MQSAPDAYVCDNGTIAANNPTKPFIFSTNKSQILQKRNNSKWYRNGSMQTIEQQLKRKQIVKSETEFFVKQFKQTTKNSDLVCDGLLSD